MNEQEWMTCEDPQRMLRSLRREWEKGGEYYLVIERKLRLFAVACCREVWHLLTDERSRKAVEVAERYADGLATERERIAVENDAANAVLPSDSTRSPAWHAQASCGLTLAPEAAVDASRIDEIPGVAKANILRCIVGNPYRPVKVDLQWLTPTVVSLAEAAYLERSGRRKCQACGGALPNRPSWCSKDSPCKGTGWIEDGSGHLDPVRLAVLADALVDAGMPEEVECKACDGKGWHPGDMGCRACGATGAGSVGTGRIPHAILSHLRDPGPHYRGDWVVDLLTGKE